MRTRNQIESAKQKIAKKILALTEQRRELVRESLLLSDKQQWFTEENEVRVSGRGKSKTEIEQLIGRIHWNEDFIDEDTGDVVTIERTRVVRINGEWV